MRKLRPRFVLQLQAALTDPQNVSIDIYHRFIMLSAPTGSVNKERALMYLIARERGYARQIARFFFGSSHTAGIWPMFQSMRSGGWADGSRRGVTGVAGRLVGI